MQRPETRANWNPATTTPTHLSLFQPRQGDQAVVCVHGMLSGRGSMNPIAGELTRLGFRVTNWGYPTLTRSLNDHARSLADDLHALCCENGVEQVHLVGHSMGCIIARLVLPLVTLPSGCRIVMLAPPNAGSRLTRIPLGPMKRWFPQLAEMSVARDSLVNRLPPPVGVEVGIIAARRDRIVSLSSTHLVNQCDHVIVDSTHQQLPMCPAAIRSVVDFLTTGRFQRSAVAAPPQITGTRDHSIARRRAA